MAIPTMVILTEVAVAQLQRVDGYRGLPMARLPMAMLTMTMLTRDIPTMSIPTMALLTMAILTMGIGRTCSGYIDILGVVISLGSSHRSALLGLGLRLWLGLGLGLGLGCAGPTKARLTRVSSRTRPSCLGP